MARKLDKLKRFGFALATIGLVAAYQNCSLSPSYVAGTSALSSLNKGCDQPLAQVFAKTYYTFARRECTSCHDNGEAGASRAFADSNLSLAFDKFRSLGRARVETMMLNAGHKPPHTGPQNQGLVDSSKPLWVAAETAAARCTGANPFITTAKAAPAAVYTTKPADGAVWPKLIWDLDVDVADRGLLNTVHATFTLEVRGYRNSAGDSIGYQFKNPVFQIKAGSADPGYRIQNIAMNLNDLDLTSFTTYALLNAVVTGTTAANLGVNSAVSAAPTSSLTVDATDTFALRFTSLQATTDPASNNIGDGGGGNTNPTTPGQTPVTYADLISANQTLGVFSASCTNCHRAGNAQGSFNITTYASAFALRATIQARMNNQQNPMPPGGLLGADKRAVVDRWINGGATER